METHKRMLFWFSTLLFHLELQTTQPDTWKTNARIMMSACGARNKENAH